MFGINRRALSFEELKSDNENGFEKDSRINLPFDGSVLKSLVFFHLTMNEI